MLGEIDEMPTFLGYGLLLWHEDVPAHREPSDDLYCDEDYRYFPRYGLLRCEKICSDFGSDSGYCFVGVVMDSSPSIERGAETLQVCQPFRNALASLAADLGESPTWQSHALYLG